MSIVEKALSKLQESGKSPIERRQVVEVVTTPTPRAVPASEPAAPSRELVARNRVNFDIAALQKAGVVPRQEHALAMRNQFRRLKWPVFDEVTARRREGMTLAGSIMIASALPGEGKTYTSCNLAMSMAREEDKRVVLIDCDIAKPQLTEVLGLSEKQGLTDFLSNPALSVADILNTTTVDRLYYIGSGKPVAHVAELISSARMHQLLNELTSSGQGVVVVLDTSPVMATNEAQALARLVPQIILVVRADKTPQPTVIEACDILGREKTSAILNQAHVWTDAEAYNAGYGYYANEDRERKQ